MGSAPASDEALAGLWTRRCGKRKEQYYDYGYRQADLLLQHVLSDRSCTHVLVTNGDNLYTRAFLPATCGHMQRGAMDLISYLFSSHYKYTGEYRKLGKVERAGQDVLFKTRLMKSWVDLGAVIVRADVLRREPDLGFFTDCHVWREADGRFIERLARRNVTRVVLERILYVHQ